MLGMEESKMNQVVLVGRLTKDPDLRYTPNGVPVATFTLAVNRTFSNQQGERETDFINCVIWRRPAENVANFLKKGSLAGVDGRIQTRNYEGQDGKRVYVTEVVAESVQFLEPKSSGAKSEQRSYQNQDDSKGFTQMDDQTFAGSDQIDISDDNLPF
jgi:single-strand DNA-binding protein